VTKKKVSLIAWVTLNLKHRLVEDKMVIDCPACGKDLYITEDSFSCSQDAKVCSVSGKDEIDLMCYLSGGYIYEKWEEINKALEYRRDNSDCEARKSRLERARGILQEDLLCYQWEEKKETWLKVLRRKFKKHD